MESANNKDLVTLVRVKTVIEEVVVSREEFDQLNEKIEDDFEFTWDQLEWKDAGWDDYSMETTVYCAYEGDVTSFTDDIVCFMYPDAQWVHNTDKINCVKTN